PDARCEWPALAGWLTPNAGIDEDHRCHRGRHHADHHGDPHHEHSAELDGLPRRAHGHHPALASRNHAEAGHVHAVHPHIIGKPKEISPSERSDDRKRSKYDGTIASQHAFERTHRPSALIVAPPALRKVTASWDGFVSNAAVTV